VEAFAVPAGPPRFAAGDEEGHTVGFMLRDQASRTCCAFVPGCGALDDELLTRLADADALLFDGTFWSDDELIALGIGQRTARALDHLPIAGRGGSLEQLAALPCRHRIYTHINNTNPMLLEDSPERAIVTRAGITIGVDGLHLTL
jgi:pyrroloquinoline quinone biosynthesis protein B